MKLDFFVCHTEALSIWDVFMNKIKLEKDKSGTHETALLRSTNNILFWIDSVNREVIPDGVNIGTIHVELIYED